MGESVVTKGEERVCAQREIYLLISFKIKNKH